MCLYSIYYVVYMYVKHGLCLGLMLRDKCSTLVFYNAMDFHCDLAISVIYYMLLVDSFEVPFNVQRFYNSFGEMIAHLIYAINCNILEPKTTQESKDCQLELASSALFSTVASSLGQLVVVGVLGTAPISMTTDGGDSVGITVGKAGTTTGSDELVLIRV